MPFQQKYSLVQSYLSSPSKRRSGLQISPQVKFVVAHDTGNPGSTARGNVSYYERSHDEESASAHIFVDDKEIIECIPALTGGPEKAWHVLYRVDTDNRMYGYNANDVAIGVEYCYGNGIDADEAYRRYVWTIAHLCYRFNLDPSTSVVGHAFLDPTRKTDPVTGLSHSRRSYEQLLRDIPAEYQVCIAAAAAGAAGAAPARATTLQTGQAQVAAKLNVRKGQPSRMADVVRVAAPGTRIDYVGWVTDGEPVNGNAKWFFDASNGYFWSGATV